MLQVRFAGVAQLVEQLICNQQVMGSSPFASSMALRGCFKRIDNRLNMARFPSGQRGQTVNLLAMAFGGSNPPLATMPENVGPGYPGGKMTVGGSSSAGRASAFQAEGRGFDPRLPLQPQSSVRTGCFRWDGGSRAHVAQSVERVLGKDEVSGSIPLVGSIRT